MLSGSGVSVNLGVPLYVHASKETREKPNIAPATAHRHRPKCIHNLQPTTSSCAITVRNRR